MPATVDPRAAESPRAGPRPGPECICCGASLWEPHWRALCRCAGCGFVRADLELSPEEVARLYREGYFRGGEYGDYLADAASHRRNFARRFQLVAEQAPDLQSVFEVGCAYGFWLAECARRGLECAGADVCPEAVAHATDVLGQEAYAGDFLTLPLEPGRFQAVCMWDTIEHLARPDAFVRRAAALLPAGGWLFLTTGDLGSAMAGWRGPKWRMIHPPTHLQYFARPTMARFLTRHGFEPVAWQSLAVYRNVGEVLGRLSVLGRGLPKRVAGALARTLPGWALRRGFWLDLGDIMFVAARKAA
jgi:SAM-dependent methyltransferase